MGRTDTTGSVEADVESGDLASTSSAVSAGAPAEQVETTVSTVQVERLPSDPSSSSQQAQQKLHRVTVVLPEKDPDRSVGGKSDASNSSAGPLAGFQPIERTTSHAKEEGEAEEEAGPMHFA